MKAERLLTDETFMRETKAHRDKMDRFHALVDRELQGSITAAEREELVTLQFYVRELSTSSADLIRKRIDLQDQVLRESADLVKQLTAEIRPNARRAAKAAKIGGRS
jgi:hypothetical protein